MFTNKAGMGSAMKQHWHEQAKVQGRVSAGHDKTVYLSSVHRRENITVLSKGLDNILRVLSIYTN